MSTNAELSHIFNQMSKVLQLIGANPFRVNAHVNVARILKDMIVDVAELAKEPAKLTAIDGIGAGSAKKIIEYVQTGKVTEYEELLDSIPSGLLDVMAIPGLGPKTVKLMWEEAGITSLATLKKKLNSGELEKLPRMGAKTVQNIKESIAFAAKSTERIRLGEAMTMADAIVAHLTKVKGATRVEHAGSLRRGRDTIGDIDILATSTSPAALSTAFREMPGVQKVLAAGETKSSVRLDSGVQVDLRVIEKQSCARATQL